MMAKSKKKIREELEFRRLLQILEVALDLNLDVKRMLNVGRELGWPEETCYVVASTWGKKIDMQYKPDSLQEEMAIERLTDEIQGIESPFLHMKKEVA